MKISKYILIALIGGLFMVNACQKDDYKLGELVAPSALTLSYQIVGVSDEFPDGDGSGIVNFIAGAEHEITFTLDFGDGKDKQIASEGDTTSHQFSINGLNTYNVTVSAVGTGGITSSKTLQVKVFSSFDDDEAVAFLTGGESKKWYWAADQPGHTGLGPNFEDPGKAYPAWYVAAPFEKTCMYDDEFVFTKTENGFTLEQTAGPAFIPGTYANKIGVGPDACYGADVVTSLYGVKNVSLSPSSSIATVDGGYRGTTMNFSDGGFMGWWVGVSEYEIIEVSDNILKVRVQEDGTYAWYHTFTNVKPEQK